MLKSILESKPILYLKKLREPSPEFKEVHKEFSLIAWETVQNFIFVGILSFLYSVYSRFILDESLEIDAFKALFNKNILILSFLLMSTLAAIYHFVRNNKYLSSLIIGQLKLSYSFFSGMIFIYISGLLTGSYSIPYLPHNNFLAILGFVETIIFLLCLILFSVIVNEKTPNRNKLINRIAMTSVFFALFTIAAVLFF